MNIAINLQALAIVIAGLALIFSGSTYWRSGDWRKSDVWKTLTDAVASLGTKVSLLESRTGELPTKISSINDRLTRVEAHLDDMPSKADIAELRATLVSQGQEIDVVRDTAIRIENWLRDKT